MSEESSASSWDQILDVQLPGKDDRLFATANDWQNNACLNWIPRTGKWDLYATGYKDAADLLASHACVHGRRHDTLVYPILFLYRQYLELSIKDLIQDARRLLDKVEPLRMTHRIDDLWRTCAALLDEISPGDSSGSLENVGRLIGEFSRVDPKSMAFRYPEDQEGRPSLEGLTHINLRVVKEVIGKISVILGGAGAMIGEYSGYKSDMQSEYAADHNYY